MPSLASLLAFAALSLGLAITPGPNMVYLVSRSLAQGPVAGAISLLGCQLGSALIMVAAACGVTAALLAVPYAYDVLRIGGALYLAWLAWQNLRPGGAPLFAPRPLPAESTPCLLATGAATALLNPKVALFYMAVLPPFIDPARGSVLLQGMVLGTIQILICTLSDAALVAGAGRVSRFLLGRPAWLAAQRYVLGAALGLLAVVLVTDHRK